MRIEVLVGNDEPIIYPLNSAKVSLGSSEHCDIFINADGVSRKHLIIINEGDNYFVVDQGSTNGSFINEQRLVPGRRVELTSFFPVRLGDAVLVSLLSDEEAEETFEKIEVPEKFREISLPKESDGEDRGKTTVISLKDLNKVKTESLIQTRDIKRSTALKGKIQKVKPPVKKKSSSGYIPALSLFILIAGGAYNYYMLKSEPPPKKIEVVGKIINVARPNTIQEGPENPGLIPKEELVKKEDYATILNDLKCTTEVEISLCDAFPGAREQDFGVTQIRLTVHVLVNGAAYLEEARRLVPPPAEVAEGSTNEYKTLQERVAAYVYLLKLTKLEKPIDVSSLKDMAISIALTRQTETGREVYQVIALRPEILSQLPKLVSEDSLPLVRTHGLQGLNFLLDSMRIY